MSAIHTVPHLPPASNLPDTALLVAKLGITILDCRPGLVTGSMPVAGNQQPIGIMHGGASAVLAETLGSVAGLIHAGERGQAVGLDLSCTHHRWVATGEVTGVCRPLHEGRTSASYEIVISDDAGRRVCSARLTCAVRREARTGDGIGLAQAWGVQPDLGQLDLGRPDLGSD